MRIPDVIIIVLSVLAVGIAAIAWNHFQPSRTSPNYCIGELKIIDGAKEQWAIELKKTTNDIPEWSDLVGSDRFIKQTPVCREGGRFTIGKVGELPKCSIGGTGHSLPYP